MKKTVYLLCAILFTAFTFMASPAKAQNLPCNGSDPINSTCPINNGGTGLPINNGAIYLLIAGIIVGIAAVKKHKTAAYKA